MKQAAFFIIAVLILASCKPQEKIIEHYTTDTIISVEHDPSYTIPDSAFWKFVIECDSNYNAVLKELEESNSGINTEVQIKKVYYPVKDKQSGKLIQALQFELSAWTDSIETLNTTIRKLHNEKSFEYIEVDKPVPFVPAWHWWVLIALIVLIGLNAFIIYRKVKSGGLQFPSK